MNFTIIYKHLICRKIDAQIVSKNRPKFVSPPRLAAMPVNLRIQFLALKHAKSDINTTIKNHSVTPTVVKIKFG